MKGGYKPKAGTFVKIKTGEVMSAKEWEDALDKIEPRKGREMRNPEYKRWRDLMTWNYTTPKMPSAPPSAPKKPNRGPMDAKLVARVRHLMTAEKMSQPSAEKQAMKEYSEGKL